MEFASQDVNCYFPLNRSGNIFEINQRYKRTDSQTLILFLFLVTCSFLLNKERCHTVLVLCIKLVLCATLSLIIYPIVFVLLFIFAAYRQVAITIEKIKLGSSYGGVLSGSDAIWTIEDSYAKSIINVLIVVKSDESGPEFFKRVEQQLEKVFFKTLHDSNKILATYEKCCGYCFLKKDTVKPSDCIKRLNIAGRTVVTENELMILLSKISNSPLPKNHSTFWEVYIGTQNVEWNSIDQKCFPIVFRVHHAMGDGAGLLEALIHTLVKQVSLTSAVDKTIFIQSWRQIFKEFIEKLFALLQAPYAILLQGILRKEDNNILHGPALSGEKLLAIATDKHTSCLSIVKEIKRNINGIRFSDVLFTAISGSIHEYISKHAEVIPETITTVIPTFPNSDFKNFTCDLETLKNSFSVALLDMPMIQINNNSKPECIDALKVINKETSSLNLAVDYQVNYWILNVISKYVPEPLLKPLLRSSQSTLVISNLPGPKRVSLFKEYDVEDIVFWIPHRGKTGLGISVLSYDDRFQIGLNVDRALISKVEDAQSIVDGIFKEIVKMGHSVVNVV